MTTTELEFVPASAAPLSTATNMKALVYPGPAQRAWEDKPRPRMRAMPSCGLPLRRSAEPTLTFLKGDLPAVIDGRIPGHEGIGVVEQVGAGVSEFQVGDKVLISCVSACLKCDFCKKGTYSHCRHGGWPLGYTIDGTQAEYVRIPTTFSCERSGFSYSG